MISCANSKNTNNMDKQYDHVLNGDYTIQLVNGSKNKTEELTLTFNDSLKTVSGYSGCNRFNGKYEITENNIKIGPLASTRMLCQEDKNKIESTILKALYETTNFVLDEGVLFLKKNDKTLIEAKKQESNIMITYRASTRGFYELITVSKDSLMVTHDRNQQLKSTVKMPSTDWKDILVLIEEIELEILPTLEAPSKTHQYDAAAAATLEITANGKAYKTNVFDNGNPPKSIESIVNKVLSMKKMVEKQ
jgi:heat shock protein HslJ